MEYGFQPTGEGSTMNREPGFQISNLKSTIVRLHEWPDSEAKDCESSRLGAWIHDLLQCKRGYFVWQTCVTGLILSVVCKLVSPVQECANR